MKTTPVAALSRMNRCAAFIVFLLRSKEDTGGIHPGLHSSSSLPGGTNGGIFAYGEGKEPLILNQV